jgi:hypothetical protein
MTLKPEAESWYFTHDTAACVFTAEIREMPAQFQNSYFETGFSVQLEAQVIEFVPLQHQDDCWQYRCTTRGWQDYNAIIFR